MLNLGVWTYVQTPYKKQITMNGLVRILTGLSGMFLACVMTVQAQNPDSELFKKYFSPATETPVAPAEDGYISRWTMLEPIPTQIPSNRVLNDDFIRETFKECVVTDYDIWYHLVHIV